MSRRLLIPAAAVLLAAPAPTPVLRPPHSGPSPTTTSGRTSAMKLRLTIDGHPVTTTLIADLPLRLSTSGAPAGAEPKAGDLAYHRPWGNLV
ncbi:cyclophilin-like fold protein [Streptomyces sp. NPDC005799]|uniref:cyclophilin-like fold protein n=1 Tax=Streptomyces sp. NPDC005799 TaxID=3154678 RepID=UPI0033DE63EA